MIYVYLSSVISLLLLGCKYEMFVSPFNRMINIMSMLFACIPVVGLIYTIGLIIAYGCEYNKRPDHVEYINGRPNYKTTNDETDIHIRDTKINRWLFDDINWGFVDHSIEHSIEEYNRIKALEEAKKRNAQLKDEQF